MSGKKRGAPENDPRYGDAFKDALSKFSQLIVALGSELGDEEREESVAPLVNLIAQICEESLENNAETTAAFARVNGRLLTALLGTLSRKGYEIEAQSVSEARRRLSIMVKSVPHDPSTRKSTVYGESNNNHFSSVNGRSRRR